MVALNKIYPRIRLHLPLNLCIPPAYFILLERPVMESKGVRA